MEKDLKELSNEELIKIIETKTEIQDKLKSEKEEIKTKLSESESKLSEYARAEEEAKLKAEEAKRQAELEAEIEKRVKARLEGTDTIEVLETAVEPVKEVTEVKAEEPKKELSTERQAAVDRMIKKMKI